MTDKLRLFRLGYLAVIFSKWTKSLLIPRITTDSICANDKIRAFHQKLVFWKTCIHYLSFIHVFSIFLLFIFHVSVSIHLGSFRIYWRLYFVLSKNIIFPSFLKSVLAECSTLGLAVFFVHIDNTWLLIFVAVLRSQLWV